MGSCGSKKRPPVAVKTKSGSARAPVSAPALALPTMQRTQQALNNDIHRIAIDNQAGNGNDGIGAKVQEVPAVPSFKLKKEQNGAPAPASEPKEQPAAPAEPSRAEEARRVAALQEADYEAARIAKLEASRAPKGAPPPAQVPAAPPPPPPPPPAAQQSRPPLLVVMRHSERLDVENQFGEIDEEDWPDKLQRPWDTPISDWELPEEAAHEMSKSLASFGDGGAAVVVVASPFRRTLQTAGVVARTLGVSTVRADNRIGEALMAVQRCCDRPEAAAGGYVSSGTEGRNWGRESMLSLGDAQVALGDDLQLIWESDQDIASWPDDITTRARDALPAIARQFAPADVVVVTHGDLVNAYLPSIPGIPDIGMYKAEVAGFAAIVGPHALGGLAEEAQVVSKYRLTSLM